MPLQAGLMMDRPLLISALLEHGAAQHGAQEIVSRETHGPLHRSSYAEVARRAQRLANALKALGLAPGHTVASIAWNNHRHLEAYFGVSGSGMVMHTCNPRLHPQQLIYILNHAEDRVVLFDATFAPIVGGEAVGIDDGRAALALADIAAEREGLAEGQPGLRRIALLDHRAPEDQDVDPGAEHSDGDERPARAPEDVNKRMMFHESPTNTREPKSFRRGFTQAFVFERRRLRSAGGAL